MNKPARFCVSLVARSRSAGWRPPNGASAWAQASRPGASCRLLLFFLLWIYGWSNLNLPAQTIDPEPGFDAANKLYEQGHYTAAAAAYESLIQSGTVSPGLYFNLGNAWFKGGKKGRAIAAYRTGLRLAPRDPSLRFNLQFVRQEVTGKDTPLGPWWQRWLNSLTINEWTLLFVAAFWLWFSLLTLRETQLDWRKSLRGYTASVGLITFLLLLCLASAVYHLNHRHAAVVVSPEAVVRYGPLEESQVYFQLRDGMELVVLDKKAGDPPWLQVQDATGRAGWLKRDEVVVLAPRRQ